MSTQHAHSSIEIEPEAVAARLEREPELQLIDVRERYERDAGHIAGSRHVPLLELHAVAAQLQKSRPVIAYCRIGTRSEMAAQALRAAGFEAYSMSGGLLGWAQEGRPLSPEGGHVADH